MAKLMRIDLLCDWHQEEEREHVFAESVLVLVPGKGIREVELCEDCQKQRAYVDVVDLASRVGQEPGPSKPKVRKVRKSEEPGEPEVVEHGPVCPEVDCERHVRPFVSVGGRNLHLSRIHGYTKGEFPDA